MKKTSSITLRLDLDLLRAVKIRAIMNDRSANGEISAILKDALKNEKAPEHGLGNRSDASRAE